MEKSARDIAKMHEKEYEEPERDLMATKPSPAGGDVDNPVANEHSHGTSGEGGFGSDERPRLAEDDEI